MGSSLVERGQRVKYGDDQLRSLPKEEVSRLRTIVVSVQEIDIDSVEEMTQYFTLLQDSANREHFVGVPQSIEELALELRKPEIHGLVAVNALNEIVGYGMVRDAAKE